MTCSFFHNFVHSQFLIARHAYTIIFCCFGWSNFNWASRAFRNADACATKTKLSSPKFIIQLDGAEEPWYHSTISLVSKICLSMKNSSRWAHELHFFHNRQSPNGGVFNCCQTQIKWRSLRTIWWMVTDGRTFVLSWNAENSKKLIDLPS